MAADGKLLLVAALVGAGLTVLGVSGGFVMMAWFGGLLCGLSFAGTKGED